MQEYGKLKVWEKAHALVLRVYSVTRQFPVAERYGLTAQLRRSSASVAINIAEGAGRSSRLSFAHFVEIAASSASETEYQLLLAKDLAYVSEPEYAELAETTREVRRMLTGLRATLVKRSAVTRYARGPGVN
jgi:four helix bundle protein